MRRALVVLTLSIFSGTAARADGYRWDERHHPYFRTALEPDGQTQVELWLPENVPPQMTGVKLTLTGGQSATSYVLPVFKHRASLELRLPPQPVRTTVRLISAFGQEPSEAHPVLLWGSPCGQGFSSGGEEIARAADGRAPRWLAAPRIESIHALADGAAYARMRLPVAPDDEWAMLRIDLRDLGGHELLSCVETLQLYEPRVGGMVILPPGRVWPDRVIGGLTLLDLAGHASETRTIELPVIHHHETLDGDPYLSERLLLFLAVPFLLGLVVGHVLGLRARSRTGSARR